MLQLVIVLKLFDVASHVDILKRSRDELHQLLLSPVRIHVQALRSCEQLLADLGQKRRDFIAILRQLLCQLETLFGVFHKLHALGLLMDVVLLEVLDAPVDVFESRVNLLGDRGNDVVFRFIDVEDVEKLFQLIHRELMRVLTA